MIKVLKSGADFATITWMLSTLLELVGSFYGQWWFVVQMFWVGVACCSLVIVTGYISSLIQPKETVKEGSKS